MLNPGNFDAVSDVLHKMFIEGKICIAKAHTINEEPASLAAATVLQPLIRDGFAAIAKGGIDIGQAILHHPEVDEVMMTGGTATYDVIVWGPRSVREENKKTGNKVMAKPFHAELGAATPVMIVPGPWTPAQVTTVATQIMGMKSFNSGHICCSPQVRAPEAPVGPS